MIKLSDLTPHPDNPRKITDAQMAKLKESIRRDPEYMPPRPLVVNKDNIILAGNQRWKALKALGYDEIPDEWVRRVDWDEEKSRRFVIMDNHQSGEWDEEILLAKWTDLDLDALGLELDVDDMDIIFDDEATNSNSGGHDILTSVSFWIYDHKITDSRDHVWDFVKKNKERIRDANQEKVVDAILRALNEVLD